MATRRAASKKSSKKQVPKTMSGFFQSAFDEHERIYNVVALSRVGISQSKAMPRLLRAIDGVTGKNEPKRIEAAEARAALAESEIANGFPVLHSLATVALWSWLEHMVKGVVVLWILENKSVLKQKPFERLEVKVSQYLSLNRREQAMHLVGLLEQQQSSPHRQGINRFESLLQAVYLSGPIDDCVKDDLFELQQVRNVIAHQNGKCDQRLKQACPTLKLKIGRQVPISAVQIDKYAASSMDYAIELLMRIGDRYDVDVRGAVERTKVSGETRDAMQQIP